MSTPTRSQGASGTHHSSSNNPAQVSAILAAPASPALTTPGGLGAVKSIVQRAASRTSRGRGGGRTNRASGQGRSQSLP
ncbi:hypothetical protein JG687_00011502 [Phytophthora cactorum]|uniref:Uncharacterized protein n=1 Tax=Phytophthora cactorum TaxID=29920 RepID=A0A8T1U6R4_9STRA|nr:hypothetical protein PC116_g20352 [Phytophthora cactorum]KAG6954935.1 hypothetical protein JG687_00011502 [Phytophthora cactorum]